MTAWFGLQNGWRPLGILLFAATVHEAGHCLFLCLFRVPFGEMRLSLYGAVITLESGYLSYPQELAAVLAGPAANLLCGLILAVLGEGERSDAWAGAHLVLGLFNLLPVRQLDGGHALQVGLTWALGPNRGEGIVRGVCGCAALALAAGTVWVLYHNRGSLWLLPVAVGMARSAWTQWRPEGRGGSILHRHI